MGKLQERLRALGGDGGQRVMDDAADALDACEAALRKCRDELERVREGSTGGIPNNIVALIPEAIEAAKEALSKLGDAK